MLVTSVFTYWNMKIIYFVLFFYSTHSRGCLSLLLFDRGSLYILQRVTLAFFTSNIHRRRQIDPRLAFHLESLTFCMEVDSRVDSRRLLRRTPWQRLLLWWRGQCASVRHQRWSLLWTSFLAIDMWCEFNFPVRSYFTRCLVWARWMQQRQEVDDSIGVGVE